jgi:hypothetical protein
MELSRSPVTDMHPPSFRPGRPSAQDPPAGSARASADALSDALRWAEFPWRACTGVRRAGPDTAPSMENGARLGIPKPLVTLE